MGIVGAIPRCRSGDVIHSDIEARRGPCCVYWRLSMANGVSFLGRTVMGALDKTKPQAPTRPILLPGFRNIAIERAVRQNVWAVKYQSDHSIARLVFIRLEGGQDPGVSSPIVPLFLAHHTQYWMVFIQFAFHGNVFNARAQIPIGACWHRKRRHKGYTTSSRGLESSRTAPLLLVDTAREALLALDWLRTGLAVVETGLYISSV
jgi:hypothetical protein